MKKQIILLLSVTALLSSCRTTIMYSVDPFIHPAVDEKNDFNIGAGIHLGEYASGLHVHSSYALTDHFYISTSFTDFSGKGTTTTTTANGNSSSTSDYFDGMMLNGSAGYFCRLKSGVTLLGGAGYVYGNNLNTSGTYYTDIYHNKYYIQPGIGFGTDFLSAGFGLRFGMLDIIETKSNDPMVQPGNTGFDDLFLFEPGFSLTAGGQLKGGFQLSYCFSSQMDIGRWSYLFGGAVMDNLSISLFLRFDINPARHAPQSENSRIE